MACSRSAATLRPLLHCAPPALRPARSVLVHGLIFPQSGGGAPMTARVVLGQAWPLFKRVCGCLPLAVIGVAAGATPVRNRGRGRARGSHMAVNGGA